MVTTIHGFSSPRIIPVYVHYNDNSYYVAISNADRSPELRYTATVYNGINTGNFSPEMQPEGYLLYFGRIHPHKGTYDAIQIAKSTGHRLVIAGIVQDEHYFREKVAPYLDEQITYIGPVGGTARNTLLGRAKALLHPIYFNEPFGLSVAEAMYCGTPVLAYNRGAMPELIHHQQTGLLVNNLQEAIASVPDLQRIDRHTCHAHALAHFSQEKMVRDYLKVYEVVLG